MPRVFFEDLPSFEIPSDIVSWACRYGRSLVSVAEIGAVERCALNFGWDRARLWGASGLISKLGRDDRITGVTREYITIEKAGPCRAQVRF